MRVLFLLLVFSVTVNAEQCRQYTEEQLHVINEAYSYGFPYDYGFTLSAIVIKESFLGDRILRYNPNDPSTGITQIQFDTLKHLSGLNHWDAIKEAETLMYDDYLSFKYAVKKLDTIQGTFWNKWKRYNGKGQKAKKYASDIQKIINNLKTCNTIPYSNFG